MWQRVKLRRGYGDLSIFFYSSWQIALSILGVIDGLIALLVVMYPITDRLMTIIGGSIDNSFDVEKSLNLDPYSENSFHIDVDENLLPKLPNSLKMD